MHSYTTAELESARKAIVSTIRKCEKVQATLIAKDTPHTAQLERLAQQLRVLYIAETLIAAELGEQPPATYSQDELSEVLAVLPPLVAQIEKIKPKFSEGTPQHTLAVRRIAAFNLVRNLVNRDTVTPIHICTLRDCPELIEHAAAWFSQKWDIPAEAYRQSMEQCIRQHTPVPQWYVVQDDTGTIIAGAGVIENDFHDRRDLSPNLCALFVEEHYRSRGIARQLLEFASEDVARLGINKLYLVTDHIGFYERYGWTFLTMVHDTQGIATRMYELELDVCK